MAKSSHSEVETYLSCQRKHYYSYGLGLQSAKTGKALYRGSCGHAALDAFYSALKDGKPYGAAVDLAFEAAAAEGAKYDSFDKETTDQELQYLLAKYFDHWEEEDSDIEVLATEYKIRVPVGDGNVMTIVVDLLTREPGVGIVATDHKFTWDFFNPESVDLNPQLVKYMAGLRMANIPVARVQYNELRTRVTKENRGDPAALFKRTPFKPNNARIERTMREHLAVADQIVQLKALPIEAWGDRALRVANRTVCVGCSYQDVCINELNGWGAEKVILNEYVIKPDRGAIESAPLITEELT